MDNNSNQQQTVQPSPQPQPIEPVSSIQPDQQPPAESQSFIPPSHDFLHILKLTIIVLLLILITASIGAGGYFLGVKKNQPITQAPTPASVLPSPTPTPDPTANWKTYTYKSSNVNYSFKYPQNWVLVDQKSAPQLLYDNPDAATVGGPGYRISIGFVDYKSPYFSITDPIGTKKEIAVGGFAEKIEDLNLGDYRAAKYKIQVSTGSPTDISPGIRIYAPIEDKSFLIELQVDQDQNFDRFSEVLDQILSTFKFTN